MTVAVSQKNHPSPSLQSKSAEFLRQLEKALGSKGASSASKSNSNPVKRISDLEKHLDDVSKNKGYLSKPTALQNRQLSLDTMNTMATRDPQALLSYRSYLTVLDYKQRSRFIDGVERGNASLQILRPAAAGLELVA